jgi:hypothetical protein
MASPPTMGEFAIADDGDHLSNQETPTAPAMA